MPPQVFSNPNAEAYVTSNYEFARFKQYLASPGDIFESAEGCRAIGLGPDSDISRLVVGYYDPQVPGSSMALVTLSPGRSFAAPISAIPISGAYQPSGRPGKILLWSEDKYDPDFRPTINPDNKFVFEPPFVDIIQYFADPPESIEGMRADKEYYYQFLPGPVTAATGRVDVAVPFYGRRYAYIRIENPQDTFTVSIYGVDFQNDGGAADPAIGLMASFALANGVSAQRIVLASTMGLHDYLMISFVPDVDPGDPFPVYLTIRVSDKEQ